MDSSKNRAYVERKKERRFPLKKENNKDDYLRICRLGAVQSISIAVFISNAEFKTRCAVWYCVMASLSCITDVNIKIECFSLGECCPRN